MPGPKPPSERGSSEVVGEGASAIAGAVTHPELADEPRPRPHAPLEVEGHLRASRARPRPGGERHGGRLGAACARPPGPRRRRPRPTVSRPRPPHRGGLPPHYPRRPGPGPPRRPGPARGPDRGRGGSRPARPVPPGAGPRPSRPALQGRSHACLRSQRADLGGGMPRRPGRPGGAAGREGGGTHPRGPPGGPGPGPPRPIAPLAAVPASARPFLLPAEDRPPNPPSRRARRAPAPPRSPRGGWGAPRGRRPPWAAGSRPPGGRPSPRCGPACRGSPPLDCRPPGGDHSLECLRPGGGRGPLPVLGGLGGDGAAAGGRGGLQAGVQPRSPGPAATRAPSRAPTRGLGPRAPGGA